MQRPRKSNSLERFGEDEAMTIASGIVFDFFDAPTKRFMKADRAFVAHVRDGLHALGAGFATIGFEGRIQQPRDASTPKVRMNADEVDVPCRTVRRDKPKQKPDEMPFVLDDASQLSELVEVDGMGEGAGRSTPPAIDDGHDMVEIAFFEGSRAQVVQRASAFHPSRVVRAYLHRVLLQKPFARSKKVVGTFSKSRRRLWGLHLALKNMLAVAS